MIRLTDVQLIGTQRYAAYGKAEVLHTVSLPALRGTVYDSSGTVLAISEPETTVIADDFQITDPTSEAVKLAPLLSVPESQLSSELSQASGYVQVASEVGPSATAKVEALDLPGLTFQSGSQRFLPSGNLALPVIGQVNSNGVGYSGIEEEYNSVLTGHSGSEIIPQDPSGKTIPGKPEDVTPARPGEGLVLTINSAIQYDTESALAKEIVTSQAQSGWAIILAANGDILAMADLDAASTPGSAPVEASANLALTNVYEPGSVAKLATFAGALSDGLITPQSTFTIPPSMTVGGKPFSDAETHGYEQLTASQILAQSSNLGTIEIAQQLGAQGLYNWLRAIGFGSPTGLDFPGASEGLLPVPSTWSGSTMGSMPIGQAEAVTALQIADAYNMVANGGVFVPPRLVEATISPEGVRHAVAPAASHRVISSAVAGELTTMLGNVVGADGTAPDAAITGYTVVGKTGTAQIPSNGSYTAGQYVASFVGIVPAQHPALTMVVSLNQPGSADYYGGTVAAPVFSKVAGEALQLLQVPPGGQSAGAAPSTSSTTLGGSASTASG